MMTHNKKEFLRIVSAYLDSTATEKQNAAVEQYFNFFDDERDILDSLERDEIESTHNRVKAGIDEKIKNLQNNETYKLRLRSISIAATILCIAALSIYFYNNQQQIKPQVVKNKMKADIAPGSNRAILTLSNGSKISLNDAKIGTVSNQNGTLITKANDSGLVYKGVNPNKGEMLFNRIETPRGGQYQISLPDGTKVWLNASSSLKYPLAFSEKERKVELEGEAYFEVAKNRLQPFKVFTKSQTVEVLGTHFNVNSYNDEPSTKTSLIEGSISVMYNLKTAHRILRPGQQSILTDQNVILKNIDIDEVVAWKNGYFKFNQESLQSILRKISRWYDVDIEYTDEASIEKLSFSGTLSKYSNVSKVLNKLELTNSVRFKIIDRKIIVSLPDLRRF